MEQEIRRTVQVKLKQTPEQAQEIEKLFAAFKIGLNFSLRQIEDAYQRTMKKYRRIEETDGLCAGCSKEKPLIYSSEEKLFCNSCVMREYSEYTIRGMTIGTSQRPVDNDIKSAVEVENKTHFHMMFAQAYATWKSFNTWRNKREFERKRLNEELSNLKLQPETKDIYSAAEEIWERAARIQRDDKKITRRTAMAMASKEIYALYPAIPPRDIARIVNKLREQSYLKRPLHFPEYKDEKDTNKRCNPVRAIQLHKNFVQFKDGVLHVSLFHKKNNGQAIDFYRNKYLDQFLAAMEEDNQVYTNLIKKVDGKKTDYYLMYPLTVKKDIPTIYDLTDVFTICFSPDGVLVHGRYNGANNNNMEESHALSSLKEERYLFGWDEIQGKDSGILIKFLKQEFGIGWDETAKIEKIDNSIRVTTGKNCLSLGLNNEKDKMNLKIDDGRSAELIVKNENSKLNIYQEKSLIPVTEINSDGQSLVWFRLGNLLFAKSHLSDKRRELMEHNTRSSLRRVRKMGNLELRFTKTFDHILSHTIVEYIAERSDNPLITMWDMTSGITADYGKKLNRIKRLWPAVQQQAFIKHKAFLRCIPVKMIPYKEENVLTCSYCHKPFRKKDEFGKPTKETIKTITALLRRIHNIKCENCGHELNLLINQARNLSALAVPKDA